MSTDKNKLIPELRFPEFVNEGEWDNEELGEISEIVRGGSPRPIQDYTTNDSNGLNWLKIADVPSDSKYVTGTKERVIKEAINSTREVNPGDLILSNSMSFGRPYILKITTCIHDGWIAIRKISNKTFEDYLYYFICSESSQSYFQVNAAGAAVKNLNAEIIKLLPIYLPKNKSEQQKIASCLSSLDEVIAAHSQKLATLKDHKKGLMQNLFPTNSIKNDELEITNVPKYRFPEFLKDGEWVEKKLGEVLDFVMGNAFKSNDFVENGVQLLRMGNLYQGELQLNRTPVFLPNNFVGEYPQFLIKPTDLLMSMTGTLGKRDYGFVIQIPEISPDLLLNQRVLKLMPKENYIKKFVLQLFKNETFLQILYSIPGGTKQANLSTKDLKAIKIPFPKLAEQQKIASCLSTLDDLITAQAEKIAQLKLHKKGLMQGLFPKSITN